MAIIVNKKDLGLKINYSKDLFYSFCKSFQPIVGNTLYLTINRNFEIPCTNEKGVICLPSTSKKSFVSLKHEIAHHLFQSFFGEIDDPVDRMFDNVLEDRRIEHLWGKVYKGDGTIFEKRRLTGLRTYHQILNNNSSLTVKWNVDNAVRMAIEIILHDFDPEQCSKPIAPEFNQIIDHCVSGRELAKKVDSKTKFVVAQKLRQILEKNFPYEMEEARQAARRINKQYGAMAGSENMNKKAGRGSISSQRINDLRKKRQQKKKQQDEVDKVTEAVGEKVEEEEEVFIFDDDDDDDNSEESDEEEVEEEVEEDDDSEESDDNSQGNNTKGDDESSENSSTGSDSSGSSETTDGGEESDGQLKGAGGESTDELIDKLGLENIKEAIKQSAEFQDEINECVKEAVRELVDERSIEDELFTTTKSTRARIGNIVKRNIKPNPVFVKQGASIAAQLKKVKSGITYGASYTGTRLNIRRLINFKVTGRNPRVFDQKTQKGAGLELVILVDISGSMTGDIIPVINVCTMLYKAASMVPDMDLTVIAFKGVAGEEIYHCKSMQDVANLVAMCGGGTPMVSAIRYSFAQFKSDKRRIFIMLTDGAPNGGSWAVKEVAKVVDQNRRRVKSIGYYIRGGRETVRADRMGSGFFYKVFGSSGWYIRSDTAPLVIKNLLIKSLQQAIK